MANRIITVLGTSPYLVVNYDNYKNCRYIQEAIVRKRWDEGIDIDEVIVIGTSKSKEYHWKKLTKNEHDTKADNINNCSLKEKLNELSNEKNFKFNFIEISEGFTENEVWETFQKIDQEIDENDNIYLDITHGFRYMPILFIGLLNYLKVVKNVKLEKIEYGMFEKLGYANQVMELELEDRNAEIMELTYFDKLIELSYGMDTFLATGNPTRLTKELDGKMTELQKKYKGKSKHVTNVRGIMKNIDEFHKDTTLCRGGSVNEDIQKILAKLDNLKKEENKEIELKVVEKLIEKIDILFCNFSDYEFSNLKELLNYYCEKEMVQQGFTLLNEMIISFIIKKYKSDVTNLNEKAIVKERMRVSKIMGLAVANEKNIEQSDVVLFDKLVQEKELLEISRNIGQHRNDINHFGMRDNSMNSKDLIRKYREMKDKFIEICS